MAFDAPEYKSLAVEERLLVGSVLLEYLTPLIADNYIFESQMMQFLRQLMLDKKVDHIKAMF